MIHLKKYISECIGTLILVFFGCGSVVFSGTELGMIGISLVFTLTVVGLIYTIGNISGCHINPAVSFGLFTAGKMKASEMLVYWIFQIIGAILGAILIYLISVNIGDISHDLSKGTLGSTTIPAGGVVGAFILEIIFTFILVITILTSTSEKYGVGKMAGVIIGCVLMVLLLTGIQVTGTSVNPARSIGPALISEHLSDIWLFITAPLIGGGIAGGIARWYKI